MRRLVLLTILVMLVGLSLTGCGDPQAEQIKQLDDAIHDVERALGRYLTADPQGSASELQRTTDRVVATWESVREAAEGLDQFDLTEAEEALDELVRATDDLAEDLSVPEGLARLQPYIDTFEEAVDEIHDALGVH